MPPLWPTIAPVIGPSPLQDHGLSSIGGSKLFQKISRPVFSSQGSEFTSILFLAARLKRKQIFALTSQFPTATRHHPATYCYSLSNPSFSCKALQTSSPPRITELFPSHVSPAACRPVWARGPPRRHSGPRQPVFPCHCKNSPVQSFLSSSIAMRSRQHHAICIALFVPFRKGIRQGRGC